MWTALQRSLAHAISARNLRLEQSMACCLPYHRAFHCLLRCRISLLVLSSKIGLHIWRFLRYVVSIQARSCNEMGFSSFFNNMHLFLFCGKDVDTASFAPRGTRFYSIRQDLCSPTPRVPSFVLVWGNPLTPTRLVTYGRGTTLSTSLFPEFVGTLPRRLGSPWH